MKIDWLRVFTPSAWFQLTKTDWDYDYFLNEALDLHGIAELGHCTCKVGTNKIWIGNYPYSYGCLDIGYGVVGCSLKTRRRLRKMVADSVMIEVRKRFGV